MYLFTPRQICTRCDDTVINKYIYCLELGSGNAEERYPTCLSAAVLLCAANTPGGHV